MQESKTNERHHLSYASYLAAKKSVDDRALNHHVVETLRSEIARLAAPRILEVGAGVGTMVARLAEWGILARAEYTLLDSDAEVLEAAPKWLGDWAKSTGRVATLSESGTVSLSGGSRSEAITVTTMCVDIGDFLATGSDAARFDFLIANAFLDLVDVPTVLPALFDRLVTKGLFWFSINFDGETIFLPEHDADDALLSVYHRSMDERVRGGKPAGDSRSGRHLFQNLTAAGARILAAGSSDWVVHAVDGTYPAQEADFVEHILYTIEQELNWREEIDQRQLASWLATRREQLARGALTYVAHQLDFLGRRS
jgi:SAM-dependent methyltransferase